MFQTDGFTAEYLTKLADIYIDAVKNGIATSERQVDKRYRCTRHPKKTQSYIGSFHLRSLDLFPKILSSIASQEKVIRDGTSTSGQDYKSHLLNSLFAGRCENRLRYEFTRLLPVQTIFTTQRFPFRWARGSVVHLASMLKEVPMSDSELIQAIRKLLRLCRELALQELPPLIYQLLLLASKVTGPC